MSGTKKGGLEAAAKNLARDPDFYKKIGRKGGTQPKRTPSGFAYLALYDPEKLREASAKGGFISRRTKKVHA